MVPHKVWATTRRDFLARAGLGFGALALSAMMADEARADAARDRPAPPARPPAGPLRRRRPRAASSCSWRAAPATSTCSTPSPS